MAGGLGARRVVAAAAVGVAAGVTVLRVARWLPARVVAARMWVFARVNGDEGIAVPGPLVDASRFRDLYTHPAATGRSRGAALSDLFWYWLSPGPDVHQEHLEAGPRYDEVARTTRRILAVASQGQLDEMVTNHTDQALTHHPSRSVGEARTVRLRDLMMPVWAGVFADVVFGGHPPPGLQDLVVGHADDVVTSLKCCGLRHMDRRHRLTRYLAEHLDEVPHALPAGLTRQQQALYLQGTFFNTAVVQMSEATAHLLMVLAQHPELQARLGDDPDDDRLFDQVLHETLRVYPLFGIAHRITTGDIALADGPTLPAGSVLCFNYPALHRVGFDDPDRFDPSRWNGSSTRNPNYIPFGVPGNRPCPASHLAPAAMRAAAREVLRRFTLHSTADHTRSLPNRGPCLLVPRDRRARGLRASLGLMRVRDQAEDVGRSLVQLVLGTTMVWDARRQRLCQRFFDSAPTSGPDGRA